MIYEDFKTKEEIPFATRGYTDLWKRDWNGRKVAVKALRFGPDDDRSKTTKVRSFFVVDLEGFSGKLTITLRDFVKKYCCGNV